MQKSKIILLLIAFFFNIDILRDYRVFTIKDNYLNIPKIGLHRPIYEIGNKENNVDKNIELISNNTNNFILAGHSGNTNISYFNDLRLLSINDFIYFNYQGFLYIYQIKKIYEIPKNGYFKIEKYSNSVINLVTCKNNSNTLQVVYVGYLLN